MLRVRALLRRHESRSEPSPDVQAPSSALRYHGKLKLDESAHRCWVEDKEISLTALEFRLLCTLLDRAGRVQTRDTLLSDVWGMQPGITTRTVDTHVRRLRVKLGNAEHYIETLRGVGYRLRSDSDVASATDPVSP